MKNTENTEAKKTDAQLTDDDLEQVSGGGVPMIRTKAERCPVCGGYISYGDYRNPIPRELWCTCNGEESTGNEEEPPVNWIAL